ncbi:MAG TPA: hypothetical protein VNA11_12645, partial [Pseudonocardia sp.]|nr:hypothetical protein [Pseudonocardia sp.]
MADRFDLDRVVDPLLFLGGAIIGVPADQLIGAVLGGFAPVEHLAGSDLGERAVGGDECLGRLLRGGHPYDVLVHRCRLPRRNVAYVRLRNWELEHLRLEPLERRVLGLPQRLVAVPQAAPGLQVALRYQVVLGSVARVTDRPMGAIVALVGDGAPGVAVQAAAIAGPVGALVEVSARAIVGGVEPVVRVVEFVGGVGLVRVVELVGAL